MDSNLRPTEKIASEYEVDSEETDESSTDDDYRTELIRIEETIGNQSGRADIPISSSLEAGGGAEQVADSQAVPVGAVAGGTAAFLLLVTAIIGFLLWRRKSRFVGVITMSKVELVQYAYKE